MKRRSALIVGVASTAGAAGLGAALWRTQRKAALDAQVWDMQFDQPAGGQLALKTLRGQPLLLNFWATWCPPCVSELPLLDRFQREHAVSGWQVAGVAVDNLKPVTEFLTRHPVGFAIGLAGGGGIELARTLGNSGGALPFTAVFDRSGDLVRRKLGVITAADLQDWVKSVA